ncbi:MAG: MFS transporter [Saprospiraceae bacterium]|nr:MFS transporter [Saprospiraceae bacterium]
MEKIKQSLRESKRARWTALVILSFTMFAGYLFNEIISPLKPLIDKDISYGWTGSDFGMFFSAYGWFNVFFVMLIIVGYLLDRFGVRFSTLTSSLIMIIGAGIKYYAFKTDMGGAEIFGFDQRLMIACIGFALFGVGVEFAGITVSKAVVKWFKGKEIALAMGMQVAIARLGSFVPLMFGAYFATQTTIPTAVLMGVLILIIGFFGFLVYNVMDTKLEKEDKAAAGGDEEEEKFKLSDLKVIVTNRGFWLIAILCVLFYSAVFPFYKYGPDLMVNKFGVPDKWSGLIPSLVPFGTIFLTPFFGGLYDKKGKGASIMILGAFLLVIVHLIYWLPGITSMYLAFANAILLGIAFSLVPSAMWPSVPKIIPEKQIGSAFAFIFWIQNFGLWGIPLLVGIVLNSTNPTIVPDRALIQESFAQAYTEEVSNSPLINTKNFKGEDVNNEMIAVYGRLVSGDLISEIVSLSPQEVVADVNPEELRLEIIEASKEFLSKYFADSLDIATIHEMNKKKENLAFIKMDEAVIHHVAKIIASKKIKVNYNYETTWLIFVMCTFLALIIAFWLKAEDKRKGYGLELPNIKK